MSATDDWPDDWRARVQAARALVEAALLAERAAPSHWTGELSSSALSTATAVTALTLAARERSRAHFRRQAEAGANWLATHANPDGGWGDTTLSLSNLSTTTLVWAAFGALMASPGTASAAAKTAIARAEDWLRAKTGGLEPARLAPAIIARYGKDRTFSVPILTMCALAGRLGPGREAWRHVIPLPFELAACPPQWFAALRLPVVSYALPALIAIGQAHHHHCPTRNPFVRLLRRATQRRTLTVLARIQPENGGFLEATPLTSFVTMSLLGSGQAQHVVAQRGLNFLAASQRADGSWPIDTNLATWLTTLSVNALPDSLELTGGAAKGIRDWLLRQQYRELHPYTQAAPGGWAWTDLPGGVPDADDTAGALLALRHLAEMDPRVREAAEAGVRWLMGVQNRDGGVPTFCRGWGTLPFDRSSADITAHALRAWQAWRSLVNSHLAAELAQAMRRALHFLRDAQAADGSWAPLWFGNQHADDETNPTYGTSRVLTALAELSAVPEFREAIVGLAARGARWLEQTQNADGGWGGAPQTPSSVEETGLAVEALAHWQRRGFEINSTVFLRGVTWLVERVESGRWKECSPIGFYFARLWYFEKLYPLITTVAALRAAVCRPPLQT
jgi:squalene-hopene/tetraprenyl-beta-curcumene cyclase